MAMLQSEKETLWTTAAFILAIVFLGCVLYGISRVGHQGRLDVEHQFQVKTTLFITQHHLDLRPTDIHCIITDANSFNWCSYPLNGHTAWAICSVTDGCFTNY